MQGYFDGGSRGNPGHSGAGWVIYDAEMKIVMCGTVFVGVSATNNTSEYTGLIHLLRYAIDAKIEAIDIFGDSKLVIDQVLNVCRCMKPHLIELRDIVRDLMTKIKCTFRHVLRKDNSVADKLSNIAMDESLTSVDIQLLSANRPTPRRTGASSDPSSRKTGSTSVGEDYVLPNRKGCSAEDGTKTYRVRIRRTEKNGIVQDCDIYVGREWTRGGWNLTKSDFSNPFRVTLKDTNEVVVRRFETYINSHKKLLQRILNGELSGKSLGCFCDMKDHCHADYLAYLANNADVVQKLLL